VVPDDPLGAAEPLVGREPEDVRADPALDLPQALEDELEVRRLDGVARDVSRPPVLEDGGDERVLDAGRGSVALVEHAKRLADRPLGERPRHVLDPDGVPEQVGDPRREAVAARERRPHAVGQRAREVGAARQRRRRLGLDVGAPDPDRRPRAEERDHNAAEEHVADVRVRRLDVAVCVERLRHRTLLGLQPGTSGSTRLSRTAEVG